MGYTSKLFMVCAVGLALALTGCEDKEADKRQVEAAKRKEAETAEWKRKAGARRAEECRVVAVAEGEVFLQGRTDLIEKINGRDSCGRLRVEGCDYKVEFMFELNKTNRLANTSLGEKIAKIGEDCTDELSFATKHGLEAFRDHRALLEAAVEAAIERAVEEAGQDRDNE